MVPLQAPGVIELLVVVLIFAILLTPVAVVAYFFRRRGDRVRELEARVRELEGDRQAED